MRLQFNLVREWTAPLGQQTAEPRRRSSEYWAGLSPSHAKNSSIKFRCYATHRTSKIPREVVLHLVSENGGFYFLAVQTSRMAGRRPRVRSEASRRDARGHRHSQFVARTRGHYHYRYRSGAARGEAPAELRAHFSSPPGRSAAPLHHSTPRRSAPFRALRRATEIGQPMGKLVIGYREALSALPVTDLRVSEKQTRRDSSIRIIYINVPIPFPASSAQGFGIVTATEVSRDSCSTL